MKKEAIIQYYNSFEAAAMNIDGVECWSARELQQLLGYSKWENFSKVIDKAKISCQNAGHEVAEHFPDVRKMSTTPKLGVISAFFLLGRATIHRDGENAVAGKQMAKSDFLYIRRQSM